MTPKIAIIILNWNGKKDTLECLKSLKKINYPNYETILVDNGSTDDSVLHIREQFPSITLIENKENLGFAEGNNRGIRYALKKGVDLIFLLNNDTVIDPDILNAFVKTFQLNPEAGVLGAKIYLFEKQDTLDHFGGNWNSSRGAFDFVGSKQLDDHASWEVPQEIDYVCGAGMMISANVFKAISLLEKDFFLIWEEADFCFRAKKAGFKVLTCPSAKIWHKVSASFSSKPHSTYFWWRNRLLWIKRNCTKREQLKLYITILIPSILHLYKMQLLTLLQLFFKRTLTPQKNHQKKRAYLINNRAALQGVHDFFFSRFGNAPAWIYTIPSE